MKKRNWSAVLPASIGIVGIFTLIVGLILWGINVELSSAVIASGRVQVEQNRQAIQHAEGGMVQTVHVTEGEEVSAGSKLISLKGTELLATEKILENKITELEARRMRFVAERDGHEEFDISTNSTLSNEASMISIYEGQKQLFEARYSLFLQAQEQLDNQKSQLLLQESGLKKQKEAVEQQSEYVASELADMEKLLQKGLVQVSKVNASRREFSRLSGEIGSLEAEVSRLNVRMTEIDLEILRLKTERREYAIQQLRDLTAELSELQEQFAALRYKIERLEIVAPVSGIVYGLSTYRPETVIRPAEDVLFLIPQDTPLVIIAKVDPIHIDQIYIEQDVRLRLTSLNQSTTPELIGEVGRVSADAFDDQRNNASYYEVEIRLPESEIARLEINQSVLPGMPVEIFFTTGSQTPLEYFTKPMADYFQRAWREL